MYLTLTLYFIVLLIYNNFYINFVFVVFFYYTQN